jgi:formate hydrogenlyase transcriptional activator
MLTGTSRYEVETPLPASRAAYAARRESSHREPDQPIVGESDSLKYVMSCVERVADTDATVLLSGETGTGKELVARALHQRSRRRTQPFVVVNCAAMPATLIESELFGRERGAFTDATVTQAGRFEVAHRGTLFLDEIGELPVESQSKLLRVLQNGQVERLGSPRPIDVDVRIIAATNRDLQEEVRTRRFRTDLFYRLNVIPITVPALRDRRRDVPLLVRYFAEKYARTLARPVPEISRTTMDLLESYDWPGNVRELMNVIQRAVVFSEPGMLDIPEVGWTSEKRDSEGPPSTALVEIERRHITQMLEDHDGRIEGPRGAAKALAMRPSTLRSRMSKLGIARTTGR